MNEKSRRVRVEFKAKRQVPQNDPDRIPTIQSLDTVVPRLSLEQMNELRDRNGLQVAPWPNPRREMAYWIAIGVVQKHCQDWSHVLPKLLGHAVPCSLAIGDRRQGCLVPVLGGTFPVVVTTAHDPTVAGVVLNRTTRICDHFDGIEPLEAGARSDKTVGHQCRGGQRHTMDWAWLPQATCCATIGVDIVPNLHLVPLDPQATKEAISLFKRLCNLSKTMGVSHGAKEIQNGMQTGWAATISPYALENATWLTFQGRSRSNGTIHPTMPRYVRLGVHLDSALEIVHHLEAAKVELSCVLTISPSLIRLIVGYL